MIKKQFFTFRIFYILILFIILLIPLNQVFGADLSETLKGRILLQVEEKGEAWYVNPDDGKRYFLGLPRDAFEVMRGLGLGISEKSYNDFDGFAPSRLAGKILLRVEANGEAYYVNPVDKKMYFLGKPADAFAVMRSLGLGITNKNINKIYTWFRGEKVSEISSEDGRLKASNFINKYLVQTGTTAIVGVVKKESGIYVIEVLMPNEQKVQVGMSLNGEKFFSQVYNSNLVLTPVVNSQKHHDLLSSQAIVNIESYLEKSFLSLGNKADITNIELEDGVFKISFTTTVGANIESFMTTDGKKFFPQVIDIEDYVLKNSSIPVEKKIDNSSKQARPHVELFVMSYCPYGLQIEKGIIPVLELLGDKIDFELKFVNYAMHGQKELNEQLNQYCIQEKFEEKILPYLKCFSEGNSSQSCMIANEISESEIATCVVATDNEYSVTNLYNDKNTWQGGRFPLFPINNTDVKVYDIKGSPVLIINGETVASARDSASLLEVICSAFISEPSECVTELSNKTPAPGFGIEVSDPNLINTCNQ